MDPYNLELVRMYLTVRHFYVTGTQLKTFARLGDRLAASILLAVDESHLSQPETANRVARAISSAFADEGGKTCPEDRLPFLSIYLLEKILVSLQDGEARRKVIETLVKLKDLAAKIRAEE